MKMIEVKITDNSTAQFARVARLQAERQSGKTKWTDDQIEAFNLTMAKLVESEDGWVMLARADKGQFTVEPGYKLDLVIRMLTGAAELPILRKDVAS